jgi:hypothetical protein
MSRRTPLRTISFCSFRFPNMRTVFFFFFLQFTMVFGLNAQTPCNSYITEEVVFVIDSVRQAPALPDTSSRTGLRGCTIGSAWRMPGSSIRAANSSFTIISFVMSVETPEGDIMEANCTGNIFSPMVLMAYKQALPDSDIFFACIKARHTNGKIYTLKPFTIRR